MKLYQATIECSNSCYIETLLIIAENEENADKQLCEHKKRKVKYKRKLKELEIDFSKPNVIPSVGFGENESNYEGDD